MIEPRTEIGAQLANRLRRQWSLLELLAAGGSTSSRATPRACVFGAPTEEADAAGRALAAGRLLSERLRRELPQLGAGIGISAGPAVAGNVGAERRLEYTVVGDPVNEAARLCDLAKQERYGVLVSVAALERAAADEAAGWQVEQEATLRGRTGPTRLAVPAGSKSGGARSPAALTR